MSESLEVGKLRIGTEVDHSGIKKADARLRRDSKEVGDRAGDSFTEGFVGKVERLNQKVGNAVKGALSTAVKAMGTFFAVTGLNLFSLAGTFRGLGRSTARASGELTIFGKALRGVGGLLARTATAVTLFGVALTGATIAVAALSAKLVEASTKAAGEFIPAWNRVLTLFPEGTPGLKELRSEVSQLAATLGVDGTEAARAFYNVLSAMPELLEEPTRAVAVLDASLKVASTGFGTAEQAAAAITTIMNAFNLEAEEAIRVSDALFATQGSGVTTFGEVASQLGRVADLAAQMGVGFEEVLGIIATVTPGMQDTGQAVTELTALLSAFLNVTPEARKEAARFGVDISASAIEARGLNAVIRDLIEATDGDITTIADMVGGQEARKLLVQLIERLDELDGKTRAIAENTGGTDRAVEQMNESWERQKEILDELINGEFREIGFGFEEMRTKGLTALNDLIRKVKELNEETAGIGPLGLLLQRGTPEVDLPAVRARPPTRPGGGAGGEATTLEHSQAKIEALETLRTMRAITELARTGDVEAYRASLKETREAVNELVLSEIRRLEEAGVSKDVIADLAKSYNLLQEATDGANERLREREQALSTLKSVEEDVTGRLASLTATAVDDMELELDRLEARAREAAEKAGVALSEEFEAGMARLRQNIEDTRIFEEFSRRFEEIGRGTGFLQSVTLQPFITELQIAVEGMEDGSRSQERMNSLLERALDLRRRNADAARETRERTEKEIEAERKRQEAEAERAERERLQHLRETARQIEENARAALQLAEAFGLVDDRMSRVLQSAAQLGSAIARIAGGDLSAIPSAIGALASMFSGGGEEERAEQERQERIRENTSALMRVAKSLDDFISRLRGLPAEQIVDFRRFAAGEFDDSEGRTAVRRGMSVGAEAARFFGIDPTTMGDPRVRELVQDLLTDLFERTREQIQHEMFGTDDQGRTTGSVAAREAALRGDDVEAARITAAGEAAEQQREADRLFEAGLISAEQHARLMAVIAGELKEAVEAAEKAAEKAEEANERRRRAFEADLLVREAELSGEGGTEALRARMEAEAAAELAAAEELLEAGTITQEMFDRLAAVLEGELVDAIEAVEEAAKQAKRKFETDLKIRRAVLDGDDEEALRAKLEFDAAQELAGAQELLDAGIITQEMFEDFAKLLEDEVAASLHEAAIAAREMGQSFRDNLDVRELEASGDDEGAAITRLEIRHREEREDARELLDQGIITQEDFERLIQVQKDERRALVESFKEGVKDAIDPDSPLDPRNRRRDVNEVTRRDVTGITTFQAVGMLGVLELQLHAEREQVALLERIASGKAFQPGSIAVDNTSSMQSGGAPSSTTEITFGDINVNVDCNGRGEPISDMDAKMLARRLSRHIDDELGEQFRRPVVSRSSRLR